MGTRTWPENQWPTPDEFTDWFLSCDREEQVRIAEKAILDAQTAGQCFIRNHESLEHDVNRLHGRVLDEYRRGYMDACNAIQEGLAKAAS